MKKLIFIFIATLTLTACGNSENKEEIVTEPITEINIQQQENVTDMNITLNLAWGLRNGKYTGTLINNIPNGKGKFVTQNEENETWYYEGDFEDGHFSGNGKCVWEESGQIKEGIYSNDKLNGYGKFFINNTIVYEGNWKNEEFNGTGKLYSSDGLKYYEGIFIDNLPEENDFKNKCKSIEFKTLARQPETYIMAPIKTTGTVIQVIEGTDGHTEYRVADANNYDLIYYITYTRKNGESRILENDIIDIYGLYEGLITYKSTLSGNITIPNIEAIYISIK